MNNIAIVSVNKNKYSETFIHSQIKHLSAQVQVHYFYGGYCPMFYNEGYSFIKILKFENFISRFLMRFIEKINKKILINAIVRYCFEHKIEALLAHYGPTGVYMTEVSMRCNIPLYVYFHGYDVHRLTELKNFGTQYKVVFKWSEKLFAASKEIAKKLELMGAPSEKIIYNPCGADTDIFKPRDASLNPAIFISVGRFDDTKNHGASILAFKKVTKKYPEAKLVLIGEGKNMKACKQLVLTLGLTKHIDFKGVLSHNNVAKELSKARVFVLHSVTTSEGDKEGTPVSIMEAGASGLAIIATRHAGIPDVVEDNITGFLVPENDIDAMAECMMRFIEEPALAKEMGMAGFRKIDSCFSLKKNVEILRKHINKQAL